MCAAEPVPLGLVEFRREAGASHTPRLLLRPVEQDDLGVLLAIRNEPGVVATTSTREALPRQTVADQLARRRKSWRERAFGSWLVLLNNKPVAFVEVAPIGEGSNVDPDAVEIGVVVHPDHWGKGFALEAGLAAARDLFERVALDRVYAGVDPDNEKSLRALAKTPGGAQDRRRALRAQGRRPALSGLNLPNEAGGILHHALPPVSATWARVSPPRASARCGRSGRSDLTPRHQS